MKRATLSVLLLALVFGCFACTKTAPKEESTESSALMPTATNFPGSSKAAAGNQEETKVVQSLSTPVEAVIPDELPVYQPGSIKLNKLDYSQGSIFGDFSFLPRKRYIYYCILLDVLDLPADHGSAFVALLEENKGDFTKEPKTMDMVDFIRYYNIPKADFEKAVEKERQGLLQSGHDLTEEQYELPNADILYTFDNDIIDEYYRRE